jgi:hypothetical protein
MRVWFGRGLVVVLVFLSWLPVVNGAIDLARPSVARLTGDAVFVTDLHGGDNKLVTLASTSALRAGDRFTTEGTLTFDERLLLLGYRNACPAD